MPCSTRPVAGRPCSSGSPTAPPASRSSRSGCRPAPRRGWRRPPSPPRTGPPPTRWWWRTSPTSCGPSTSGCLGLHLWPYLAADPAFADELRIDLDPQPGVGFDEVRTAAFHCRDLLDRARPDAATRRRPATGASTSTCAWRRGGMPPTVRSAAVALARELERRHPDLITANWWKEERGKRVFVDFNQNAPHKTVFAAWFARPRTGGQVSTPLVVGEVADVVPDDLTIRTVPDLLRRSGRSLGGHRHACRSRSSRCSTWPSGTRRPGSTTRRGRPSTQRAPTSRRGWRPAGRRRA